MAANLRKTNKCYRCGAEIEPGSRYCMECGAPLKKPHGNGMIAGVAAALVIVAVFGGNAFKKNAKEADTDTDVQTESLVSDVDFEDQMTETQETEETTQKIDADISAVDSETCTLQGTLYYTSKMEDPVLVLKDTKSVYLNSTSGERILYNAVSSISISSYPVKEKMMQQYNNVEVALEGSLWAEDDTIYMDVENIYGEAREEETEKETQKKTEKATEKKTDKKESTSEDLTKNDYIIPDSDKKYLTDADVENLTLREQH